MSRPTTRDGGGDGVRDAATADAGASRAAEPAPGFEVPSGPHLDLVVRALRRGAAVTDAGFDGIYPAALGARANFWTPVAVARRAVELLVTGPATRVLDVGSGCGKFCLVGALRSRGHFTGVEQRGHLVAVARTVARRYRAARATYVHGDMRDVDWRAYDAVYLFNPFGENRYVGDARLDDSVELTPARHERDAGHAHAALARAAVGTRVVTYNGLGRELPSSYERVVSELFGAERLELWLQRGP